MGTGALLASLALAPAALATHNEPLRGQWHLDGFDICPDVCTATSDSSGHGLTGARSGTPPTTVAGRFGNALHFSNENEFVNMGNQPLLQPPTVTLLAWVRAGSTPATVKAIAAQGAGGSCSHASYALYTGGQFDAPGLRFYIHNGSQLFVSPAASNTMWDGGWHLVAGTYDGAAVRLYVDGQQVGSGTPATGSIGYGLDVNNDFRIGSYGDTACTEDTGFPGDVDETRVFSRALSATEIGRLAAAAGPTPPDLVPDPHPPFSPPVSPPVASFDVRGESLKLKGATRFSALVSKPSPFAEIVDYNWRISGPDKVVDMDCGKGAPTMAHPFRKAGLYDVKLTVTDSLGKQSSISHVEAITKSDIVPKLTDPAVFDCENPAAGEQASTKDCPKSFAFGIVDVNSRGGPGDCFKIKSRINPADLVKGVTSVLRDDNPAYLKLYEATIKGPVALNGIYLPIPKGVETHYDSGDDSISLARAQSISIRIGPFLTKKIDLNLKVKPDKKGNFHAFDVDEGIPAVFGGLPSRGALSVNLFRHASRTKVGLGLPSIFSFGNGKSAQGDAYLISDNVHGVQFDGVGLLLPQALVGPILVENLAFKYIKSQNLWSGGAKIKLPGSTLGINAAPPPPDFGFGLKNGKFDHAGFGVEFSPPTQPDLFPPFHSVLLSHIGAALGVNPLRLTGTIGVTSAQVVDEDGVLFAAFATPSNTYDVPSDVGDELAPIAGKTLDSFSLAIGGTAKLHVPVLGVLPLLHSYGLYQYPDSFEFGGGFDFGISFLKITGDVKGFVLASQRLFNVEGGVRACLRGIRIGFKFLSVEVNPCLNVGAVVSSKGIGFCGIVPVPFPIFGVIPVTVGAGYKWGDSTPDPKIWTCDYGDYREVSPRAAAGTSFPVVLPGGLPAAMIRVRGQGGAPNVTVTDPQGHDAGGSGDVLVLGGTQPDTTFVAIRHPTAGTWTVTAKPGSPPIAGVASATGLPPVGIRARVTGRARRRVLAYRIAHGTGRKITFLGRGPRTARQLGVARGSAGRIAFTPAAGRRGRRSIVALVEVNGSPARVLSVASYKAPAPARLQRPGHVRVTRRKRTIRVTWNRVRGVARYEVLVELADGSRVFRVVRGNRASLPDRFPRKRGRVRVDAVVLDGARGATASVRLR